MGRTGRQSEPWTRGASPNPNPEAESYEELPWRLNSKLNRLNYAKAGFKTRVEKPTINQIRALGDLFVAMVCVRSACVPCRWWA